MLPGQFVVNYCRMLWPRASCTNWQAQATDDVTMSHPSPQAALARAHNFAACSPSSHSSHRGVERCCLLVKRLLALVHKGWAGASMAAHLLLHAPCCPVWGAPPAPARHTPLLSLSSSRCSAMRLGDARARRAEVHRLQASSAAAGFFNLDEGLDEDSVEQAVKEGADVNSAAAAAAPSQAAQKTKKRSRRYRDMASRVPSATLAACLSAFRA